MNLHHALHLYNNHFEFVIMNFQGINNFRKARCHGVTSLHRLPEIEGQDRMSKFIDKLKRLREVEPQPMGFAIGKTIPEKPRLQLAASLPSGESDSVSSISNSVDAVAVELAKPDDLKAIEKICQTKDGAITGGWFRIPEGETLSKVTETPCDFIIFPANSTLVAIQKEKIGKVLELDETISDGLLRTANDLPVDAVLISDKDKESPFTLNRLMIVRRMVQMLNKPVIVSVSDNLTGADLQALWDMGISGILIESVSEKSASRLEKLRKAIEKLTPSASRKRERPSPILPHMQPEAPPLREDEEPEDE